MNSEDEEAFNREHGKGKSNRPEEREVPGEEGEAGEDDTEECVPPEEEKEMLFLIEFLVDALLLKPENMGLENIDPCLLQGQICITLTFLHFPPMKICELDIDRCRQTGGNFIKFNSGKSLMFALSESQFENPPPISLDVVVYKMLPHGSVPNNFTVGVTKIGLTELFKQVFDKVSEKPDKLPLSKSIKDNYTLIGKKKNCPTGEVSIYIRLSCLGQNVVTEFQRGIDSCEPFLFKSKESRKVYECKPKETTGLDEAHNLCPPLPGWGALPEPECGDCQVVTKPTPTQPTPIQPTKPTKPNKPTNSDVEWLEGYSPGGKELEHGEVTNDDGDYEEFGTEIQGHALTIKVQKSQRRRTTASVTHTSSKGKTIASTTKLRADGNQINFQVPQSQHVCTKGKERNKAPLYNIESSSLEHGGRCGDEESSQDLGIESSSKDIFVLKIGKKGDPKGQARLELELKTPKQKIDRPIDKPRVWDKMVQTEREDQPKKGKKKKK